MLESYHAKYRTPFAVLGIRTVAERVTDIDYLDKNAAPLAPLNRLAERVCGQIEKYLEDPEFKFDLPFDYMGTPFQCDVWRQIAGIPPGSTRTYAEIARVLRTAPRPIGGACGRNRLPLVIPCHRVLSSSGLGGFMRGALEGRSIKLWLLRHEGVLGTDRQRASNGKVRQ